MMSEHKVSIEWNRSTTDFSYTSYNRNHTWNFEGHNSICASAALEYHGSYECVNPEQAFVASMSSCHMLTFLALCAKRTYVVDKYSDEATGILGKNNMGKIAITKIELRPKVIFKIGTAPTEEQFQHLHKQAHENCFIANSCAKCVEVGIVAIYIES